LIDDEAVVGLDAFKWEEQFKEINKKGGFDVIIGNPPYVRQEELTKIKPYLEANYEVYQGTADLFVYFFERELKMLKEGSYFGMIVSNKWLRAGYGKKLRKFLTKFWIEDFIDFRDLKVFPDATIYPCIIIIRKIGKSNPKVRICKMETLQFDSLSDYVKKNSFFLNQTELSANDWNIQRKEANDILKKIKTNGILIEDYVGNKIFYGLKTGLNEAFIVDEATRKELMKSDEKIGEYIKPVVNGRDLGRYYCVKSNQYLLYIPWHFPLHKSPDVQGASTKAEDEFKKNYICTYQYLNKFRDKLSTRNTAETGVRYEWYALQRCAATYYGEFEKPKIIWGNLATRASFTFDEKDHFYINAPACMLPTSSKFILGVLNSSLISYFLKSICAERQGGFIEQKPVYISQVPIKKPTALQEEQITKYVDKMLSLNKRLNEIGDKKTSESAKLEEEIKNTDNEIDQIVYKLYGLNKKEIAIVEEN